MTMAILVTGGAGFIGSHLCERLLAGGKVVCVDNFDPFYPEKLKRRNLEPLLGNDDFVFLEADVRDGGISKLLKSHEFDAVIHLAARPGVRPSLKDPFAYEEINVKGTLNMLEFAVASGVKKFIFISSSSVYGNCPKTPWKEEYEPLPASPYGASKLAAEAYVRAYFELYGLKAACIRYFSVYGPRQRPDLAIAKFTDAITKGGEIEVFGDGSAMRDYTYITDAVEGTVLALKKQFKFEIFNIGDSNPVRLDGLISIIEQNTGRKARIRRLPEQKGDLKNTYADISKAAKLLGYSPKVGIDAGIREYVGWLKGTK